MPKYLYKRDNSPHYWFELKIPQDVQVRLGMTRVRKSTHTDSLKKATRMANIWAEEIWANIEAARAIPTGKTRRRQARVAADRAA